MTAQATKSILDLKFLSHGTLEVHDIEKSADFYQRFLGFEFVRTSPISGMVRLGGNHIYVFPVSTYGTKLRFGSDNQTLT